jgi:hypothetical protein
MTQSISLQPAQRTTSPLGWRGLYMVGLTALTAYATGVGWQAQLVSYPCSGPSRRATSRRTTCSTTRQFRFR